MSPSMVLSLFALIVFAPCLIAHFVRQSSSGFLPDTLYFDGWRRRRNLGIEEFDLQPAFPELPVCEDFAIRSFPKGLSQRRIVVRDTEDGPRLSIGEVRAAAVELTKLGGAWAAHQYALIVAATANALGSLKDAAALAARDVLESARSGHAWLEWGEIMTQDHVETSLWSETPPKIQPKSAAAYSWQPAATIAA